MGVHMDTILTVSTLGYSADVFIRVCGWVVLRARIVFYNFVCVCVCVCVFVCV